MYEEVHMSQEPEVVTPDDLKLRIMKSRFAEVVTEYEEKIANITVNLYQLQQQVRQLEEQLDVEETPAETIEAD